MDYRSIAKIFAIILATSALSKMAVQAGTTTGPATTAPSTTTGPTTTAASATTGTATTAASTTTGTATTATSTTTGTTTTPTTTATSTTTGTTTTPTTTPTSTTTGSTTPGSTTTGSTTTPASTTTGSTTTPASTTTGSTTTTASTTTGSTTTPASTTTVSTTTPASTTTVSTSATTTTASSTTTGSPTTPTSTTTLSTTTPTSTTSTPTTTPTSTTTVSTTTPSSTTTVSTTTPTTTVSTTTPTTTVSTTTPTTTVSTTTPTTTVSTTTPTTTVSTTTPTTTVSTTTPTTTLSTTTPTTTVSTTTPTTTVSTTTPTTTVSTTTPTTTVSTTTPTTTESTTTPTTTVSTTTPTTTVSTTTPTTTVSTTPTTTVSTTTPTTTVSTTTPTTTISTTTPTTTVSTTTPTTTVSTTTPTTTVSTTTPTTTVSTTTPTTTVSTTTPTTTVSTTTPTTTVSTTTPTSTTTTPVIPNCGLPFNFITNITVIDDIDDDCEEVQLTTAVRMGEATYSSIYICDNGLICFGSKYRSVSLPSQPGEWTCLAAYFDDIDLGLGSGRIVYTLYDALVATIPADVLSTFNEYVTNSSADVTSFVPIVVLVATWENVVLYNSPPSQNSTFQLAFGYDGHVSFGLTFYQANRMGFQTGNPFTGLITGNNLQGLINSANGQRLRRADENLFLGSYCRGGFAFLMGNVTTDDHALLCRTWVKAEKDAGRHTQYAKNIKTMPLCPCNRRHMASESNYKQLNKQRGSYFYYGLVYTTDRGQFGRVCSYRGQSLLNTPAFDTGSFISFNNFQYPLGYQLNDERWKVSCCVESDNCEKYFEVRPIGECKAAPSTKSAGGYGDPHILTLDGLSYTFNGFGEYTLLSIPTANFEIQCRTDRPLKTDGTFSFATVFSGFAVKADGAWLQVELSNDKTGIYIYAGTSNSPAENEEYTTRYINDGNNFQIATGKSLTTRANDTLSTLITLGSDAVKLEITAKNQLLLLNLFVPVSFQGLTQGLLGNFNGDKTDDFRPRGAAVPLPSASNESVIFESFGKTWATTAASSIFLYTSGKTYADFNHHDFKPHFLDEADPAVVASATTTCGAGNIQCIFDLVFTGNQALAQSSTAFEEEEAALVAIATNTAPLISILSGFNTVDGVSYLYVTKGVPKPFTVNATDEGIVTYSAPIDTAMATIGTIKQDRSVDVTVTLTDATPKTLSILATDSGGLTSPVIDVTFVYCSGCNEHGTCNFESHRTTAATTERFKYATCVCTRYWTGPDCALNFDACAENPCSVGTNCTDRPAAEHEADPSLSAYTCSACPPGYSDNGVKCVDINECAATPNICGGTCTNTAGSFRCSCSAGFRLASDGRACNDINECNEALSNCEQECVNSVGSFTCACYAGFTLNADRHTCAAATPPSACAGSLCPVSGGCTTLADGSATCFCKSGYQYVQNSNTCNDTDECTRGVCSQTCANTVGSYTCGCLTGYKLEADGTTCSRCVSPNYGVGCSSVCECSIYSTGCDPVKGCVCQTGWTGPKCSQDINECALNSSICGDVNKVCTNTPGSYTCTCRTGYKLVGGTCVDIDECALVTTHNCQQKCTNTVGSYSCSCNAGYTVNSTDPSKCVDYDECAAKVSGCEQTCRNSVGSFTCDCYFGFLLDENRKTCTEVSDPCELFPNVNCSHICIVVDQQAKCLCNAGYVLGADQQTCIDVNECTNATLNLCTNPDSCLNNDGGYNCSCADGFRLENDQRTCAACDTQYWGPNCANECGCGVGAESCDPVRGCICKPGWTGDKCDSDQNECAASTPPCTGTNQVCQNTPGSYACVCPDGYTDNGSGGCTDVDECSNPVLNDCTQICTNTVGGYTCSCQDGFLQDGNACNDIDECAGVHGCSQVCENTIGSYRCSCNDGFKLDLTDRQTCVVASVCTNLTKCGDNALCTSINANDTCFCDPGFKFETGSTTLCEDIPECASKPCNQVCTELEGSYTCSCNQNGYELGADQQTCQVCTQGKYGANCTSTCTCSTANTISCSPMDGVCMCKPGWEGPTCETDIDECTTNTCPDNSQCVNTDGSYTCPCNSGFSKNADGSCQACDSTHYGQDCASVCPCNVANTADCNDTTGACTCKPAWSGTTCTDDVDECTQNPNICGALKTCTNTIGSYTCTCASGYTINSNLECQNINECLLGTDDCLQVCTDTVGLWSCSCSAGYSGTGNACTPCATGTYGLNCAQTCNCNSTHSSSCDPATGCVCNAGYRGVTCSEDIDECTAGTHNCPSNSTCRNTIGSHQCDCDVGFSKDTAGLCQACSNNRFGLNCNETCACNTTHSADPNQSCNHKTGQCVCNAYWQGTDCNTDVDECNITTTCSNLTNKGCHNTQGNFMCSCLRNFVPDSNGNCIQDTATTTPVTPARGQKSIGFYIVLDYNVPSSVDLNVKTTYDLYVAEAERVIKAHYLRFMNQQIKAVYIFSIVRGSLKINYTVVVDDSQTSAQKLSEGTAALAQQPNLTFFGEPTNPVALAINNNPVDLTATQAAILCTSFAQANGQCAAGQTCVILGTNTPACEPIKTSDNFALVIGLGVGIPLFFIAALVVAIIIVYAVRMRKRKRRYTTEEFDRSSFHNGFFPVGMPTKINTWGRGGPVYGPQVYEEDSASTSNSDESKRRRPQNVHYVPYVGETYAYDNAAMQSNFSWDFLYNYISPDERYEIQRPNLEPTPHPLYRKS